VLVVFFLKSRINQVLPIWQNVAQAINEWFAQVSLLLFSEFVYEVTGNLKNGRLED